MELLLVLIFLGMWLLGFYAYQMLPEKVPVHFGLNGNPVKYGNKITFFIIPLTFSLTPLFILFITRYRFSLITKYPYLIKLPAFFMKIYQLPEEKRALLINKYFEVLLIFGTALSFTLFLIELGIFLGMISGRLPFWFLPVSIFLPLLLTFLFILNLAKLSKEIEREVEHAFS